MLNVHAFTYMNIDKSTKIGITNLFGNITTKPDSHKGGWTRLLKCALKDAGYHNVTILSKNDKFEDFGHIIFNLGAEYKGMLNLFGGLNDDVYGRLDEVINYTGTISSWIHELPNLSILNQRRTNDSTGDLFKKSPLDFIDLLQQKLDDGICFQKVKPKGKLIYGDSHTSSIWTPDYEIDRKDGRILYSTLRDRSIARISEELYEEVCVYLGNIDIRHHILRQDSYDKSANALIEFLFAQLVMLKDRGIKVSVQEFLPIENESRKLPKTGYYKGTPFYGTWKQRSELVVRLNLYMEDLCQIHGIEYKSFPKYFKNGLGELRFDVMERPGSVHLSPSHYKWDLDRNIKRW